MNFPPSVLHLGGPDRPDRALRDILEQRIAAVPAGGEIHWSTYYFRDRALAQALITASERGVRVCIHMEGHPRRAGANDAVIALLRSGLGDGLHVYTPLPWTPGMFESHLHSKIYCFSHPVPSVLVGSFNPSGDDPEDADVIAEIGDQDRGHNILVEYFDPVLVSALCMHIRQMRRFPVRIRPIQNRVVASGESRLWFYPRLNTGVIDKHLRKLGKAARVRGAISHIRKGFLVDCLIKAAAKGADIELIVHDSERRAPSSTIKRIAAAGIRIARYVRPDRLPLHAKFLLIEEGGEKTVYFGSFNYNLRSRYLNREILVASSDPVLFDALASRFGAIVSERDLLD